MFKSTSKAKVLQDLKAVSVDLERKKSFFEMRCIVPNTYEGCVNPCPVTFQHKELVLLF
jgi:hypothetical protein